MFTSNVVLTFNIHDDDDSETGDGFSYKVLQSAVSSISYHYDPEAEPANTVKVLI